MEFLAKEMRVVISRLIPVVLLILVVLACANTDRTVNLAPSANRTQNGPARNTLTPAQPTPKRVRWGYSEFDDEMGRGKVFHTSIESTNTISLSVPYEGEQHGILALREHPQHGKDVYIRIEKGQLLDSDYHGNVLVRFDNDKPRSFSSVRPADLSSETLFLRGSAFPVFLNRLRTAKTVRIEVPVYQAGNQVLIFDVEGFTWKNSR